MIRQRARRPGNCSVQVSVTPLASPDELERIVRRVVEERINGRQFQPAPSLNNSSSIEMAAVGNSAEQTTSFDEQNGKEEPVLKELEMDVSQMLDNLDFFQ